jgi:F420-dependent oxidoreductase-like protein
MRLGLHLGYDDPVFWTGLAEEAERCGFDSVWTSEAYGSDAISPLAWIGSRTRRIRLGTAIAQMPARSPATTAATAATLDRLSGGRLLLGLGTSGPQVAEGWHGQAWGRPLARTREYVSIVRAILRREEPLEHHGAHYDIPYSGAGATGLGTPLKIILHPLRREIPIHLAAIGPRNVALAAEIADGWLPIFFSPERFPETHLPALQEGFARRGGRPEGWDLAPHVPVVVSDDLRAARDSLRPMLALYVGGMGARGHNFYNDLARRFGYEAEAEKIQDLYLDGRKDEAAATVPPGLLEAATLCGPEGYIRDRIAAYRETGVTVLNVTPIAADVPALVGRLKEWLGD